MKVDPRLTNNLDPTGDAARISERVETQRSRPGAPLASSDSVTLSPDAQLAISAVEAAKTASDIRPAEVARARELYNKGLVGNDLESLASKILDSLIQE